MATKNLTNIAAAAGQQEVFITREFEAAREQVYEAFTRPELVQQWLGPRDLTMRIEVYDARDGGMYRYYCYRKPEFQYGFYGVFHECTAPVRIVQTFEFDGLPERGHVCLSTTTFAALDNNRTRVVIHDVYQSVADRDAAMQSGMERGVIEGNERLDELLEKGW